MSKGITTAIYHRLRSDPSLLALLPTYKGEPSIFTFEPVPGDAPLPLIVTSGNVAASVTGLESTKQTLGARVTRDIRIFGEAKGSMLELESIAERVYLLFEKALLPVPGWQQVLRCRANRPTIGPRDERVYMLVVTLTISIAREA